MAPAGLPSTEYPKLLAPLLVGAVGLVLPSHFGVNTKLRSKTFVINYQEKQRCSTFPPWFANAQDLPARLPGEKREATRPEKRAHRVIFPDSSRNRRKIPSLPDISRLNPTLCLSSLLLFSWHHLGAQHRHSQGFFLVHLPLLTQIPPALLTATLWENPADSPELVRIQLLCKAGASTGWFGLGGPSPWNGNFHCSTHQKKGLIASPTKVGL